MSDEALRHARPHGSPHSVWELLEHIRLAQSDILDLCVNADYEERTDHNAYHLGQLVAVGARSAPLAVGRWDRKGAKHCAAGDVE